MKNYERLTLDETDDGVVLKGRRHFIAKQTISYVYYDQRNCQFINKTPFVSGNTRISVSKYCVYDSDYMNMIVGDANNCGWQFCES